MIGFLAVGCPSEPSQSPQSVSNEEVKTTYDPQFEFPLRGTYAFVHISGEIEGYSPEIRAGMDRIDIAFEAMLKNKGFRLAELPGVDLLIDYHILFRQNVYLLAVRGQGVHGEWVRFVQVPDDLINGALVLEISDARTGKLVWRGIWNADINADEVSDENKKQRIEYAIRQLLRTFPPT